MNAGRIFHRRMAYRVIHHPITTMWLAFCTLMLSATLALEFVVLRTLP